MKLLRLAALPLLLLPVALFIGCEVDSPSDVQRNVGADFTGFYQNDQVIASNRAAIVSRNSGSSITTLDLRQGGDRLEAIDNHGIIFKGSIGSFDGRVASFELVGHTTAGSKGTMSGTLTASGDLSTNSAGATVGTMQGTWIEDSLFGTVRAVATIPGVTSGGGGGGGGGDGISVSVSSSTVAVGSTITVTAANSSGTVTWSTQNGRGHFSSSTGTSVSFTRDVAGTEVITGTDSDGSDSVTVQ